MDRNPMWTMWLTVAGTIIAIVTGLKTLLDDDVLVAILAFLLAAILGYVAYELHRRRAQRLEDSGQYEVLLSRNTLRFLDRKAHEVHLHKAQRVRALEKNITELSEPNMRCDGEIANVRSSVGKLLRKAEGAGWTYTIKLPNPLPIGEQFERVFELDFIDSFPNAERETYLVHTSRHAKRLQVIFQFHPDKPAKEIWVTDGQGKPYPSSCLERVGTEWRFDLDDARLAKSVSFSWYWGDKDPEIDELDPEGVEEV